MKKYIKLKATFLRKILFQEYMLYNFSPGEKPKIFYQISCIRSVYNKFVAQDFSFFFYDFFIRAASETCNVVI